MTERTPIPAPRRKAVGQLVEFRIVGQHHPAGPVEAHDPWRAREGTEHDDDPAVLPEMSNRLDTASRLVEEGDRALIENSELVAVALGRAVHRALLIERRRRHEEDRLARYPLGQRLVDPVERLRHRCIIAFRLPRPESLRCEASLPGSVVPVMGLDAKILTVSESANVGARKDRSGDELARVLVEHGFRIVDRRVVPDGMAPVSTALVELSTGFAGLVVTTGGTGFSPTDLTPEATRSVVEREAPGLAEAMRSVNPLGRLSRGLAGSVGSCLILNVPGSPRGAVESVEAVVDVLDHALDLLAGGRPH